jgi:hypothetical protein
MADRLRMRSDAKMMNVPAKIREAVDAFLADGNTSLREISEWLHAQGHNISKNAVGNYARFWSKAARRIKQSLAQRLNTTVRSSVHRPNDWKNYPNTGTRMSPAAPGKSLPGERYCTSPS